MSYIDDLATLSNVTVEDVIRLSSKYVPREYRMAPWKYPELNHGVNLLSSEDALCCYMSAYGEMHTIKCRTMFRNLPWDSFANIEVVDWGCGQGIGTICLAEMLRERNKLHLLQKVTLIEPSKFALNRALFNVNKFTNGVARVIPIEKYLPTIEVSEEDSTLTGITYDYRTIIHIFSNILDVNNIDLAKLSRMIPKMGTEQYIICVGPKNRTSNRIEQFATIFTPEHFLTRIDAPIFSVTSTHHQFGCRALSWKYENTPLSADAISVLPNNIITEPIQDDYEINLAVANGLVHPKASQLMEKINNYIGDNDIIYYKPSIDGHVADIVILRPNAGIYIIQVFDWDLTQEVTTSPVGVLKQLKDELITLHIKQCAENHISQRGYWSIIKMIGFFPQNTSKQIEQYCEKNNIRHEYETLLGQDVLQSDIRNIFMHIGFFQSNRNFSSIIKKDFLQLISPGWHSYREGKVIPFTREQLKLSKSRVGMQKIKGVAGSGKTEVLVHRAVSAQIRTGEKVLILTYNLSLRNYIKYRLSQVRADFAWDKFYITNYHQLIKTEILKHDIESTYASFDDEQLFEHLEMDIQKYSAIFIDEIQDYKPVWLSIIKRYFLADDGELVVFGDPKQRTYNNCELDSSGDIRIGVIPGQWNGTLVQGNRFSNAQIAHFTNLFGHEFLGEELLQQNQQQFAFDTRISYKLVNNIQIESILTYLEQDLQATNIRVQDCPDLAILSDTHRIVRSIENLLSTRYPNLSIITTSENQNQYDTILSHYNNNENDPRFDRDIKQLRRTKKVHFTIDTNAIKLSTIKSYKGLEAKNVVVIVEENCDPATLYTGLTRAKNNLIIINLGNQIFDSFFRKYMPNN